MLSQNQVIGQNIRKFRDRMGLTQMALAQYLGTSREQVGYYELGERNVTMPHLAKLADLFCIDEYEFYDANSENAQANLAFAFRADSLQPASLEVIATFKKIVKNYLHMKKALTNGGINS